MDMKLLIFEAVNADIFRQTEMDKPKKNLDY